MKTTTTNNNPTKKTSIGPTDSPDTPASEVLSDEGFNLPLPSMITHNNCPTSGLRQGPREGDSREEDSNGEVHVPSAVLKSIDSLIRFDKPKYRHKAADVYPSLSCHDGEESDLDSRIREQLSENRCNCCSCPLPIVYYQSQKEESVEATVEVSKTFNEKIRKYCDMTLLACLCRTECAQGLIGAGTNNARIAGMLRNLSSYYYKEASLLFCVRIAQGLVHLGKGLLTLAPYHSEHFLLSPETNVNFLKPMFVPFHHNHWISSQLHTHPSTKDQTSSSPPIVCSAAMTQRIRPLLLVLFFLAMVSNSVVVCTSRHQYWRPSDGPEGASYCLSWRLAVEANNVRAWRTVPTQCLRHVESYMMGGQYDRDINFIIDHVISYLDGVDLSNDGLDA
ncbi:hypothetical protein LOK49_Contig624G00003 [Camellia lanceoleosa]|nr:hypothetical protein LOK49_Contig624G00003 [Camellia lanceoleosa]